MKMTTSALVHIRNNEASRQGWPKHKKVVFGRRKAYWGFKQATNNSLLTFLPESRD
jgi:hypothetical protein